MKKRLSFSLVAMLGLAMAFFSCQDLDTENLNSPDESRALATGSDIESLVGGSFLSWFQAISSSTPNMSLAMASDTYTCGWGNFSMWRMDQEPRQEFGNTSSSPERGVIENPWFGLYGAISAASDGIRNIENGTVDLGAANNTRAIAFGKLVQGLSHGYIATMFDQGFILDEDVDLANDELTLQPYNAVLDAAIAQLQECIDLSGSTTFTLPIEWINGVSTSNEDLARIAHTFIARYKVVVARNPQERAATDWATVLSHVDRGLTDDWGPIGDGAGRSSQWYDGVQWYSSQYGTWQRVDYRLIGPSDRSNGYADWGSRAPADRQEFEMDTGDLRIWDQTRDMDGNQNPGTQMSFAGPTAYNGGRPYIACMYGHDRFTEYATTDAATQVVMYRASEADFIRAEAALNGVGGGEAEAAALLDQTHVVDGGYPSLAGVAKGTINDLPDPKPESRTLWSALKYERRMDLLGTFSGLQLWDGRGYGILTSGTPIHFPVPALDLEVLQLELYSHGGGKGDSAPKARRVFDGALKAN